MIYSITLYQYTVMLIRNEQILYYHLSILTSNVQTNGRWPVWTLMCALSLQGLSNFLPQPVH